MEPKKKNKLIEPKKKNKLIDKHLNIPERTNIALTTFEHLQRPGTELRSFVCWDLQAVHDVDELLQVLPLLCKGHLEASRRRSRVRF
jgi:hypothetical protein